MDEDISERKPTILEKTRRRIIGEPRNVKEPSIFHKLSLIPILAWMLLSIVQIQKEIVALRGDIKEVKAMVQVHLEQSIAERITNSMLHHLGPAHPCNGCHDPKRATSGK